jgi:hypothetical protein
MTHPACDFILWSVLPTQREESRPTRRLSVKPKKALEAINRELE